MADRLAALAVPQLRVRDDVAAPAYRALAAGAQAADVTGSDVRQLNHDLVAMGHVTRSQLDPSSDEFTWATRLGLERLQDALGVTATGSLALGDYVFLPGPVRVTTLSAKLSGRGALASHVRGERRTNRTRRARRAS